MTFQTRSAGVRGAVLGAVFAAAAAAVPFSGTAIAKDVDLDVRLGQRVLSAGETSRVYVRASLKGIPIHSPEDRTPVNLALVLDRSGSMRGEKLAQAKEAAILALDMLDRDDITAVVAYDHAVETLFSARRLTDRRRVRARIGAMEAGGRTALYGGTARGLDEVGKNLSLERVNRVILLSDGLANVGPSTPAELGRLGRDAARDGISVTTIGLGLGYNEDLMARLAGASDGNHAFVEHPEDLVDIFNREFGDVLSVVAQDIEIIITCRAGFRPIRVLGRDAEISGQTAKLRLNQVYGGQEKYVLLEVEVPADKATAGEADIADVAIDYSSMRTKDRLSAKDAVGARFSTSKEEVEAATDNEVMTAVSTQIATEKSEKAVELRDQGDIAGAKKLLEENAATLRGQAQRYNAPSLSALGAENEASAENLSEGDWDKTRKDMRAKQYKHKTQQSY